MTFHERGITSSVSVTSSPSFDRRVPPQAGQTHGAGKDDALARQMLGKRLPRGTLVLERGDAGRLAGGRLGCQIILAGVGFEIGERQLHLIEQATAALGARAILLAPELRDLQLEMGDQGSRSRWHAPGRWPARASTVAARCSASSAFFSATERSAFSASTSSGKGETAASMGMMESQIVARLKRKMPIRRSAVASYTADYASRSRRAGRQAEKRSATPYRPWPSRSTLKAEIRQMAWVIGSRKSGALLLRLWTTSKRDRSLPSLKRMGSSNRIVWPGRDVGLAFCCRRTVILARQRARQSMACKAHN